MAAPDSRHRDGRLCAAQPLQAGQYCGEHRAHEVAEHTERAFRRVWLHTGKTHCQAALANIEGMSHLFIDVLLVNNM